MEFVRIAQQNVRNVIYKIIKLNAHLARLAISSIKMTSLIVILVCLPVEMASVQMRLLDSVSIAQ